jgi:anaphase-promoting complex subunit 8
LAKAFFDCREFDRCSAVFLPSTLPRVPVRGKGKAKAKTSLPPLTVSALSKKALFLTLYAKYLSGEKRKDEESEMILGPADGGVTVNKELNGIAAILEQYFDDCQLRAKDGGGWLEYLYGIILAKGKNEELAKEWLIRSVNIYPFNWGAWQELANLLNTIEDVSVPSDRSEPISYLTACSFNHLALDCPKIL